MINLLVNFKKTVLNSVKQLSPKLYDGLTTELHKRLIKGSFWSILGGLSSKGLTLISAIIVARMLDERTFGEYGVIKSTVSMFIVFAGFGMGVTATRYIAQYNKKDKEKAGRIIALVTVFGVITAVLMSSIVFTFSEYLAGETLGAISLKEELQLASIILFFSALNSVQNGILVGFENFKTLTRISILSSLISVPSQLLLSYYFGLFGALIGYGLNFFVAWCLSVFSVRKLAKTNNIDINYLNCLSELNLIYKFSVPAVITGVMVSPVIWACNAILVNSKDGYIQMGLFEAANQWRILILFIPGLISQIALPMLSEVENSYDDFKKIFKLNIKVNLLVSAVVALSVSILSSHIISFYGTSYRDSRTILIILAVSSVLISVNNVIGKALASKNLLWYGFLFNCIWAGAQLVCAFYFIRIGYGGKGLALSFLVSYLIHTIVQYTFLKRSKII